MYRRIYLPGVLPFHDRGPEIMEQAQTVLIYQPTVAGLDPSHSRATSHFTKSPDLTTYE